MKGDQDRLPGKTGVGVKDSRRDRLKLALRENLKRRKMQARERDKERGKRNDMRSSDHRGDDEASPDGELGKRDD